MLARIDQDNIQIRARDIFSDSDFTEQGHHFAETLTSSAQTQIDDLETLTTNMNTDQTVLESTAISHNTRITTLENAGSGTVDFSTLTSPSEIYVDGTRTESYTPDGSIDKPYVSLATALTDKLVIGSVVTNFIFKLKPATYNLGSGVSITHTTSAISFTIQGCAGVKIRCTDLTTNVLYLKGFAEVNIRDCEFNTGAYGLYIRNCYVVEVSRCTFWKLGSSASPSIHSFSNSQATQQGHWAGTNTSDGGAMRLRSINRVWVKNNYVLGHSGGYEFRMWGIQLLTLQA